MDLYFKAITLFALTKADRAGVGESREKEDHKESTIRDLASKHQTALRTIRGFS